MSTLRAALAERVVVADGAMGTMLQGSDATGEDFAGFEGCNEILNVTRPDIVTGVHDAYLEAGADCVTTNSFGRWPVLLGGAALTRVMRLLEPSRIGVDLSEEMQLHPEQSTDAIVVHHPEAKYFSV